MVGAVGEHLGACGRSWRGGRINRVRGPKSVTRGTRGRAPVRRAPCTRRPIDNESLGCRRMARPKKRLRITTVEFDARLPDETIIGGGAAAAAAAGAAAAAAAGEKTRGGHEVFISASLGDEVHHVHRLAQLEVFLGKIRRRQHSGATIGATQDHAPTDGACLRIHVGPFVLTDDVTTDSGTCNLHLRELLRCLACVGSVDGEQVEVTFDECDLLISLLSTEVTKPTTRGATSSGRIKCPRRHAVLAATLAAARALAGHDEDSTGTLPPRHRAVHLSSPAASLSAAECGRVVAAAEAAAAASRNRSSHASGDHGTSSDGWMTRRHKAFPTTDLAVGMIPSLCDWLPSVIASRLLPEFECRFELVRASSSPAAASLRSDKLSGGVHQATAVQHNNKRLHIQDLFVAKYEHRAKQRAPKDAEGQQPSCQSGLREHTDSSPWSFVIPLNDPDQYTGGGTCFVNVSGRPVYRPSTGIAVMFAGQNRHCGVPVTSGVRYILAGFCAFQRKPPHSANVAQDRKSEEHSGVHSDEDDDDYFSYVELLRRTRLRRHKRRAERKS